MLYRKINIVAVDIYEKDAVGNFCLDLKDILKSFGSEVSLYARHFDIENELGINYIDQLFDDIQEDELIFLSYSIVDYNLEKILSLSNNKIVYFHGVTPPELLEEFEAETAKFCQESYEQFPLFDKFNTIFTNSEFNQKLLSLYTKKEIHIAPPVFSTRDIFNNEVELSRKDANSFIVVGRLVPHKNIEESIKIIYELKQLLPNIKFNIIGSANNQVYKNHLIDLVKNLGLENNVVFHSQVTDRELKEFYSKSIAMIISSKHEGFCIPILEAMNYNVITFIKDLHAGSELVDDKRLLFKDESVNQIAKTIYSIVTNYKELEKITEIEKSKVLRLLNESFLLKYFKEI
jgi:glycosyltransferase involved in cell wall biosynthesis